MTDNDPLVRRLIDAGANEFDVESAIASFEAGAPAALLRILFSKLLWDEVIDESLVAAPRTSEEQTTSPAPPTR